MQYIVAAYVLWGVFPAFFPLLDPASPLEILAHRIIWTAVLMVGILLVTGRWREIYEVRAATWWRLTAAGVVITVNWGTYVVAVMNDHVADASLGYYMNPLVSVALGVLILREHLRRWQMVAVAIAAVAVVYLTFLSGQPPVIALALAFSFGTYGLLKKKVAVSAFFSVGAETMIMLPFALGYVAYISVHPEQQSTFASEGWGAHPADDVVWSGHRHPAAVLCPRCTHAAVVDDRHAAVPYPDDSDAVGVVYYARADVAAALDRLHHHLGGCGGVCR